MTLRFGDRGPAVAVLQRALTQRGLPLRADERFGNETRAAVRAFQLEHKLTPDGIVGRETARALHLRDGFDAPPAQRRTAPQRASPSTTPRTSVDASAPTAPGSATPAALMSEDDERLFDEVGAEAERLRRANTRVERGVQLYGAANPADVAMVRALVRRNPVSHVLHNQSPSQNELGVQLGRARRLLSQ